MHKIDLNDIIEMVMYMKAAEKIEDVSENMLKAKIFKNIVVLKNENKPGELAKIYFLEGNRYVSNF
jgi:hypothetical protein